MSNYQHHALADRLAPYRLPIADAECFYLKNFLTESDASNAYQQLIDELEWAQDKVFVFGKWHLIPRLQAWHGDPHASYQYSGKQLTPQPWSPTLKKLHDAIDSLGIETNSVLANWYRDGNDRMGWHSDNEKELGPTPVIASLSLGASRTFQLKHKRSKQRVDIELTSGSLLVMAGSMQHNWVHALPQRKRIMDGRVNLTFRNIHSSTPFR